MSRWFFVLVPPVALAALCALPAMGLPGLLAGVATALAVAAAVQVRLGLAVALGSILADAVYLGPPEPAGLWLPAEILALAVLQLRATRHLPTRRAAWTGALTGLAITALPLRTTLHVPHGRLNGSVLLVAAAFAFAVAATGAGLYLRAGDQRRRRAEERARREHRLDLARDLHDLVAHEVTGIVVEAQAAQVSGDAPGYAAIEAAGLRALDAMDHMVHTLRDQRERAPLRVHGLADLPDVVARFDATGPTRATLHLEPGAALTPEAGTVAYHVVIEALTNVRRHAPEAPSVTVTLAADGTLSIVNKGTPGTTGPNRPRNGGGTGLAGLAERARAVGGTLEAGPGPGGWAVVCRLSRSADVREGAAPDA